MQFILGILIVFISIALVMVLRSFTTLIHELGHALPALLFTRDTVKVYVGTYGDTKDSYQLRLGRLALFFRINLLDWKIGMCEHQGGTSIWQRVIIILGGPLASVLLSIPLFLAILQGDLSQLLAGILMIFIIAALIDFFVNIIPVAHPIDMHDGSISFNDGYQLYILFGRLLRSKEYLMLEEHLLEDRHEYVIEKATELIGTEQQKKDIYDLLIAAYIATDQPETVLKTFAEVKKHFKLDDEDDLLIAQAYMKLNQYEQALGYYQRCFKKHFQDASLLTEMGYVKIQLGRYGEARKKLDAAIYYSPNLSKAYINRALVNIRTQDYKAAARDLAMVEQKIKNHPEILYYYGLLHDEQGNYKEALDYYEQAKTMSVNEHGLNFRMETLKGKLNE